MSAEYAQEIEYQEAEYLSVLQKYKNFTRRQLEDAMDEALEDEYELTEFMEDADADLQDGLLAKQLVLEIRLEALGDLLFDHANCPRTVPPHDPVSHVLPGKTNVDSPVTANEHAQNRSKSIIRIGKDAWNAGLSKTNIESPVTVSNKKTDDEHAQERPKPTMGVVNPQNRSKFVL
jgi:hypothetical protein